MEPKILPTHLLKFLTLNDPEDRKANTTTISLKLKNFQKFDSAATALEEVASIVEGKVTPRLANLLESIKDEKKVSLAVADPKLGMR
jgi:nucleolar protein 58